MTFFTISGGKMEARCPFMKRKRIQERIQLKETLSLPKHNAGMENNRKKKSNDHSITSV